jgi:beta-galactosidase
MIKLSMRRPRVAPDMLSSATPFRLILICLLMLSCASGLAQRNDRVRQDLNAGWLFERQAHGSGELGSFDRDRAAASTIETRFVGAQNPTYNDSDWQAIHLPHTWNAYDVSDEKAGYWRGIGWYRKHFRVEKQFAGKRIVLQFEGVNQTAEFWLNGRYVGMHKGGYTGFSFEITPLFEADNVLTIKVDNLFDGDLPPTVKTDYSFYGGIYRSVTLLITEPTYISHFYWTTPDVSENSASLRLHSEVENRTSRAKHLKLTQEVLDPSGKVTTTVSSTVDLAPGGAAPVEQQSPTILKPLLWSPSAPNLYHVRTTLVEGARVIDVLESPLGFRWFQFDPQRGLILNGKRIQVQGTNWHQSYPGMGNALPKSRHVLDMEEMHGMGVNFWRTSHYPHDKATIDASDRLGLMVWEELPINKEIGNLGKYLDNVSVMAREMIERDRNDPSILLWGIAGEVNAPIPVAKTVVQTIANLYRQLDPTRPVAMHAPRGEEIEALVDVVGASAGAETDEKHRKYPNRPYLDAEYSVALIGRGIYGADKESEDAGVWNHEHYLGELNGRPWMSGGCIWNQFDYDGEEYDPVIPHVVSFGMEDAWRIPKEVYSFYQSQWTEKPMVHIFGHWTWPGQEGKTREVKVFSNADDVQLFLNDQPLGPGNRDMKTHLLHPPVVWHIAYQPGTLRAVAKSGQAQIGDERRTAGPAYKIVLSTDTTQLTSGDDNSLAYVTARVVDEAGTTVPGATQAITFTSYGPGELMMQSWLGHGTGLTWNAIDGVTRIVFRSTPRTGRAIISAYSPGLRIGRVDIDVKAAGKPDEMNYKELFQKDELN